MAALCVMRTGSGTTAVWQLYSRITEHTLVFVAG